MWALLGIASIIGGCWLLSRDRAGIYWRPVVSGLFLQAALAFLILRTWSGHWLFATASAAVRDLVGFADAGGAMVFGDLYDAGGVVFAFKVTAAIIFVSSLVAVLYHLRLMQPILKVAARGLQEIIGVSGAEALVNTASAFVGQVESALPLRPYLSRLSRGQFFAIFVGGMSTISAALLATYASLGVPPLYLLAANMMGIPGGLALAKLVWPSPPEESTQALPEPEATEASNAIDAAVQGAQEGLHISLAVVAMVIAFVSFVALIDAGLGWFGLSLAEVLGYVFYPLSFLIGTPLEEAGNVASLIGLKLSTNEFVAYLELLRRQELCPMSPRSLMLATIALCGFANFGSVAIQLGAFSKMLPERRGEFAKLGLPAMAVGALASCLSACWASLFFGS